MNSQQCLPLVGRLRVWGAAEDISLPDWAATLVWLGAWCRVHQFDNKRLIVFAVLPTRQLAAAFAGLGCLFAGAREFKDSLSWPRFRSLPVGQGVFWSPKDGGKRYQGNILEFKEHSGAEFIVVQVTKAPRPAEVGYVREISQRYFDEYRFTSEQPPPIARTASFEIANMAFGALIEGLNSKWIWADGAEGILVTSVAKFEREITGFHLSVDSQSPISMHDLLCLGRSKGQGHAKLRIDHPRSTLSNEFPLAILDGRAAFSVHEHLANSTNILAILDRSEYQEEIHGAALQVRSISVNPSDNNYQIEIPDTFPPGIELSAYLIDK